MFYTSEKSVHKTLFALFLLGALWLTACGELEFGVETKVSSGSPAVTVVVTTVAEIPENMVLVTVTPTAQPETATATPTAVATQPSASTATPTPIQAATATAVPPSPTRAPAIVPSFTATPTWAEILVYPTTSGIVWPGETVTIEYEARSDSATICLAPVFTQAWDCRPVPQTGPYALTIDAAAKTNLLLELHAYTGETEAIGTTTIMLYCPESAWFFGGPPTTCPAGPSVETAAAVQRFEHGLMLWLENGHWWEAGEVIYVLYELPSQAFEPFPEYAVPNSNAPMPTNEYDPPEGLFVPESGFGLLWRENSWIRQRLGWALAPEAGFIATAQREFTPDGAYLYLLDDEGKLIVLNFFNGTWAERSQP